MPEAFSSTCISSIAHPWRGALASRYWMASRTGLGRGTQPRYRTPTRSPRHGRRFHGSAAVSGGAVAPRGLELEGHAVPGGLDVHTGALAHTGRNLPRVSAPHGHAEVRDHRQPGPRHCDDALSVVKAQV